MDVCIYADRVSHRTAVSYNVREGADHDFADYLEYSVGEGFVWTCYQYTENPIYV